MTDTRKVQLATEVDATGARRGFEEIKQEARSTAQEVSRSSREAGSGVAAIGDGGEKASQKVDRATASIINSIQRTTAVAEAGGRGTREYFESIARQRGVDTTALTPYLQQLEAAAVKQRTAQVGLESLGLSAKQTAFAMRGVPAQFTDIVTSLASGQNPMTVMLQQGGQLKDMFGGVGNAVRAVGGYMVGLLNPFTIIAAAATAFGVAAFKGAEESRELSRSIILTGNAAGTTVGQLNQINQSIAATTGATRGAVAEAVQAIVGSGQVTAETLKSVAAAAVQMERLTGKSIAETVKEFESLGKNPVEASLKLNEQTRYLTAEVFKQIKALEDQGRASEAAALAQNTYADEMSRRTGSIAGELGSLERAWRGIKDVAKGAWDAMLNVGREDDLEQRLAKAREKVASGGGLFGNLDNARLEVSVLEAAIEARNLEAKVKTESNRQDQARIVWLQEGDKYLTKQLQMEREIAKVKAQGQAAAVSEAEINSRIAAVREKYTEKKKPKADPAATLIGNLNEQIAVREIDVQAVGNLSAAERKAIEIMSQLRDGTLKATAAQKQQIAARLEQLLVLDKEVAAQQVYAKALEDQERFMAKGRADMEERIRRAEQEAELYGLTASQISVIEQARLADAIAMAAENGAGDEQLAYLREELALREKLTDALIAGDRKRFAADEWKRQQKGLDDFAKNAAKGMQDAMADFLFDPFKKGTQGMLQSFGEMIQKMIAQAVAADIARKLFGSLVKGGEGDGLIGSALSSLGKLFGFADGGIMTSAGPMPLTAYAGGGIATGPQLALIGEGRMNEAYVPLPDGRSIPVSLQGRAGGDVTLNQTIYAEKGTDVARIRRAAGEGYRQAAALIKGANRYV